MASRRRGKKVTDRDGAAACSFLADDQALTRHDLVAHQARAARKGDLHLKRSLRALAEADVSFQRRAPAVACARVNAPISYPLLRPVDGAKHRDPRTDPVTAALGALGSDAQPVLVIGLVA